LALKVTGSCRSTLLVTVTCRFADGAEAPQRAAYV
jgi:hypothetical protein